MDMTRDGARDKMKININQAIRVRLTSLGRGILRDNHNIAWGSHPKKMKPKYVPIKEDDEGWSKWQLHSLMSQLGQYCVMGSDLPFETEIIMDATCQCADLRVSND